MSISLSNKDLLYIKFHSQLASVWLPMCWMSCFCWQEMWYSLGYFSISGVSSSFHLSSQNLTLSLHPTLQIIPFWKKLPSCDCWNTDFKSCHHKDSLLPLLSSSMHLQPPYFESNILAQSSPWWWNRFHLHFPSRARLNLLMSLIPNPPFSFGRHIVSHLTHAIFFCSSPPPHKNRRYILTSLSTTLFGTLKNEKK